MTQATASVFKIPTKSPQPARGAVSRARTASAVQPKAARRVVGVEIRAATRGDGEVIELDLGITAGAANAIKPGADLIAWYLNPGRLPVAKRWSRKHADSQRRLCERFAAPVIGAVACQDIVVSHTQKIVNAAPTAGEGDRLHRILSAMVGVGTKGGYLVNPMLAEVHWQAGECPLPAPKVTVAGESSLWVDPGEIPSSGDIARLGKSLAAGPFPVGDPLGDAAGQALVGDGVADAVPPP